MAYTVFATVYYKSKDAELWHKIYFGQTSKVVLEVKQVDVKVDGELEAWVRGDLVRFEEDYRGSGGKQKLFESKNTFWYHVVRMGTYGTEREAREAEADLIKRWKGDVALLSEEYLG